MKKVLIGLAVVAAVFAAQAEYLIWQVDSSDYSESFDNVAKAGIGVYGTNGRTAVLGLSDVPTGQVSTDLSSYQDGSYTYYIELFAYDSSAGMTTVAHSDTGYTYSQLSTEGYLASSMANVQSMTATWSGVKNYSAGAAPEPTSGLMMLVGMALLGLKRRRV